MKNEVDMELSRGKSSAANPDLDWSQVRETVLMISLAVAQIEQGMRDGDDSVTTLAELFMAMMNNAEEIQASAKKLPDGLEKSLVVANYKDITEKMHKAIVTFQFYDKLAQRLTHVSESLRHLTDLIAAPHRLFNPFEWRDLQELIKSNYNIATDRAMFEAILNGVTIEDAMRMGELAETREDGEHNDVELF